MVQQIQVTKITEQPVLDAAGKIQRMLSVQYMVGDHGPFTELITRQDLQNNQLMPRLQAFAAAISALPTQTAS